MKKRAEKSQFFGIEKNILKNKKSVLLHISKSEFFALSLKKISSLAHQEVPEIYVGSVACNTFAMLKTLATLCIF